MAQPTSPRRGRKRRKTPNPFRVIRPKKKSTRLQAEAIDRVRALAHVRKRLVDTHEQLGEDALTRAWISEEVLGIEPYLQDLMWVEYRYSSPWKRTEYFHQAYRGAYENIRATNFGIDVGSGRPLADSLEACSVDEINALAMARAHADILGMPYDLYCQVVMEGHVKADKWRRPPRPNQMYGKLTEPRLRGHPTQEEIRRRLCAPGWDTRFNAASYIGDPVQEAALRLIHEDVSRSICKATRLRIYLRDRHAITEQRAIELFGEDTVREALYGGVLKVKPGSRNGGGYKPVCHGMGPRLEESSPCGTCALRESCAAYRKTVDDEVLQLTGSREPATDRKKGLAAARSRKSYERRRQKMGRTVARRRRPREEAGIPSTRIPTDYKQPKMPQGKFPTGDPELDDFLQFLDDL